METKNIYKHPMALWQQVLLKNLVAIERETDFPLIDELLEVVVTNDYYMANDFLLRRCEWEKVYTGSFHDENGDWILYVVGKFRSEPVAMYYQKGHFEIICTRNLTGLYHNGMTEREFVAVARNAYAAPPSPPPSTSATNEPPRDGVGG